MAALASETTKTAKYCFRLRAILAALNCLQRRENRPDSDQHCQTAILFRILAALRGRIPLCATFALGSFRGNRVFYSPLCENVPISLIVSIVDNGVLKLTTIIASSIFISLPVKGIYGMTTTKAIRLGLFGIGLAAYWPQFEGLKANIERHLEHVEHQLGRWADVVSAGIVDTPQAGVAAGEQFATERVDILFCYSGTYATSTQVLPLAQRAGVPVILLNLQPETTLDYASTDTATWLENCGVCPIPELAGAFQRSGIRYQVVTGRLYDDPVAWQQIEHWCRAVAAVKPLKQGRFGMLGHTYPGMIDMSTDVGVVASQLGAHVEILEMEDVRDRVRVVENADVDAVRREALEQFDDVAGVSDDGMDSACRIAAGLRQLVQDFEFDGLAYYYRGTDGDEIERLASNMILGNTLLTTSGVPAAGEGDLKTALAMKMLDGLGAGGAFSEFAAMDFNDHFFLMGHDGPAHLGVSDGQARLKELEVFHGKSGGGLAVEMRAASGPITIVGMTQTANGNLKLVGSEAKSLPGPVMQIGNSLHRIRFDGDLRTWFDAWCATGPTHHVALGVGHCLDEVAKAAWLLGIELDRVGA